MADRLLQAALRYLRKSGEMAHCLGDLCWINGEPETPQSLIAYANELHTLEKYVPLTERTCTLGRPRKSEESNGGEV